MPVAHNPEPRWHWRNCRSLGIRFDIWLWPWAISAYRGDDFAGGERWLHFGPFGFGLVYSIGNISSDGLDRFTGLSDTEAYERAERYEVRE